MNKVKTCLQDGHGHGWQRAGHWQCPLGMSWAHSCTSKAFSAAEQCRQLRFIQGAQFMVHHALPSNAETALDCQYICNTQITGITCNFIALGTICSNKSIIYRVASSNFCPSFLWKRINKLEQSSLMERKRGWNWSQGTPEKKKGI